MKVAESATGVGGYCKDLGGSGARSWLQRCNELYTRGQCCEGCDVVVDGWDRSRTGGEIS